MTPLRRGPRRSSLRVTHRGLRVGFDSQAIGRTVDVEVDGSRMWTATMPHAHGRVAQLAWPTALGGHLVGSGRITLRDPRSGVALAGGRFSWPTRSGAVGLAELAAAGQVVDKWGKLTAAPSNRLHRRLLEAMTVVLADLDELGYTAAITGGTLLGAVREGRILAHDDDIDLLVYLGSMAPPDVSMASYAIERAIRARGHEAIRHSDAHLQVLFADDVPGAAAHVDLFLGFHDRGVYNQPIAVRGSFEEASLLPLTEVELEGISVPSVADADAWLALCYGEGWRVPDPTFRFHTPAVTRRRFENWFGVYDLNRHFWERHIRLGRSRHWRRDATRLLVATEPGDRVIDLGCGDGTLSEMLAVGGRQVVAVDYARSAVEAAAVRPGVTAQRLNLADRRAVLDFIADELALGGTRHFLLSNVLASLTRETRANVFLLLRALLGAGSVALVTVPVNPSLVYDHHRPDTWHLPLHWLRHEASVHGLACVADSHNVRVTSSGPRTVATVRLYSTKGAQTVPRERTR
ncbi:50S ribosomal protein L11 methyltransferase [Agromyces sp. SYSU K20354]|uniref:50S ribosomal protein L11 methyltransferase n=1 Tax=Agromyces cavernae TaxID=2898659 RepID=UPI001E563BA5|nr:50S ribosomal protein L11 methyltransferase [Agromyces cavernae]MCD2444051.1 50S ribosomal protein L11 methyltransferase [Agromyces cavernae]